MTLEDLLNGVDRETDITLDRYFGGSVVYISTDVNLNLTCTKKKFLTEKPNKMILKSFAIAKLFLLKIIMEDWRISMHQ